MRGLLPSETCPNHARMRPQPSMPGAVFVCVRRSSILSVGGWLSGNSTYEKESAGSFFQRLAGYLASER
jgi:hypothetical protein